MRFRAVKHSTGTLSPFHNFLFLSHHLSQCAIRSLFVYLSLFLPPAMAEGDPKKISPPAPDKCDLIWKKIFVDRDTDLEMRPSWTRVGLKSSGKCPNKGREDTQRRWYEDRGRDWNDAFVSQGILRIAGATEAGREAWDRFSLGASRRNQLPQHLHFRLLLPDLWKDKFLLFLNTQFLAFCYGIHGKLMSSLLLPHLPMRL